MHSLLISATNQVCWLSYTSRCMWVLDFLDQVECITIQNLKAPAAPAGTSGAAAVPLGEAVVLRGKTPACGLAPACHTTTNKHLALSLASMTQTGRKHMMSVVLPAWQQTCRQVICVFMRAQITDWCKRSVLRAVRYSHYDAWMLAALFMCSFAYLAVRNHQPPGTQCCLPTRLSARLLATMHFAGMLPQLTLMASPT